MNDSVFCNVEIICIYCSCVDRGKVRLRLQLLEVSVLPSSCYQPLVDLTSEALSDKKVT